jgi:hypothetical protein
MCSEHDRRAINVQLTRGVRRSIAVPNGYPD